MDYPYSDAGVMDTEMLLQDPVYSPQGVWLGSPMGTIFGTAANGNATAVILLINVSISHALSALLNHTSIEAPCLNILSYS